MQHAWILAVHGLKGRLLGPAGSLEVGADFRMPEFRTRPHHCRCPLRPVLQTVWAQVLSWLREPLPEALPAAALHAPPQQQLAPPPPACTARWAPAPAPAAEAEACWTTPLLAGQAGGQGSRGGEAGDEPEETCNPLVWWALL